jgi:hypothetical protein
VSITNQRQLDNTRAKIVELDELYSKTRHAPTESEHVRELTLRSLKKRINQLREEIACYVSRVNSMAGNG